MVVSPLAKMALSAHARDRAESALYDELLSGSERDANMTRHTERMMARFAAQRAASAEGRKEGGAEEDGLEGDGAGTRASAFHGSDPTAGLTSDLLGEKGAWEG